MTTWSDEELQRIGNATELQITSRRADGTLRAGGIERDVVFEVPDGVAANGPIDAAYHAKYDRYGPQIVGTVVGDAAAAGTLRLVPQGDEGIAKVRDLTGGVGTHIVLEAVGHMPAYEQSIGVVRPGGVISRVGVPQYSDAPVGFPSLFGPNITLTGGPAPARAYIETLLPGVLDGTVNPGKVFDQQIQLAEIADGYRSMDDRKALKVMVRP